MVRMMKERDRMKKYFVASLIKNGILGGGIFVDSDAVIYKTGKVTVSEKYRNLVMKYEDISEISKGNFLFMPTVSIKMKNGEEHKFIIFFGIERFMNLVKENGAEI